MGTNYYLQTHEITSSSVSERIIGARVIRVTLCLKGLGERIVYLHAEINSDGNREIRGVIDLEGKKYECVLAPYTSAYSVLHIVPLDDGSYNNMDMDLYGRRKNNESN